ncbi:MAG: tyrosine-protein phosphatase [Elusimicrobia bacterium]|nr:tyrosine-protein phosphatase [Elusimicrobiota bacterium]
MSECSVIRKTVWTVLFIVSAALCNEGNCAVIRSSLPSEVPGINIPNVHVVSTGPSGAILRGNAPLPEEISQLKNYGVTDVLIFKESDADVKREKAGLAAAGYYFPGRLHQVEFPWKDMGPFKLNCEKTIEALNELLTISGIPRRTIFFHCTVGEDRTGYLAGLYRMLAEGWDKDKAFDQEMCGNGYEAGDPQKPESVVKAIRAGLTPMYLRMAELISSGALTLNKIDSSVCNTEPKLPPGADEKYKCLRSRPSGMIGGR